MDFQLRLEDIDPEGLIETTYKYGPFYTCGIGSREELFGGRFYGDSKYQFCYYGQIKDTKPGEFAVIVYEATTKRLLGEKPFINAGDILYIKENIAFFYKNFDIFTYKEIGFSGKPKKCTSDVTFNWGIG